MSYHWQTEPFSALSTGDLYEVLRLRQEVFVVEQRSLYLDLDRRDQAAVHMLCWRDHELLAYQRLLHPGLSYPESSMGRIVVRKSARGRNLGRELVQRGIAHNRERWPGHNIRINAQAYLRDFYVDLGFTVEGDEYDEDGIPHVEMLYRV